MEKLKDTLSRTLSDKELRRIYDYLEDEERPYEATVRTVKDKKKTPSNYAATPLR